MNGACPPRLGHSKIRARILNTIAGGSPLRDLTRAGGRLNFERAAGAIYQLITSPAAAAEVAI